MEPQEANLTSGERETPDRKAGPDQKTPQKDSPTREEPARRFDDWASI